MEVKDQYVWQCQPKAEALIVQILENYFQSNPDIEALRKDLLEQTSTRLFDWIDYLVVDNQTNAFEQQLEESGFTVQHRTPLHQVFYHPGAQLPRLVVLKQGTNSCGVALSVESISDFLMVRGKGGEIEGDTLSGFRRCCISTINQVSLWVIERRGTEAIEPFSSKEDDLKLYHTALEKWQCRSRSLEDEEFSIKQTLMTAKEMVELVGQDLAACLILEVERNYWQSRNRAGQLQKNRQDRLGMGWANHDHHTFRSSRKYFTDLVRLFEMVGFHCRERFYAGEEAGWGAQVMENPRAKLVLFLDVDLAAHELEDDFAHHPMPELEHLGTIGLWCALHGDSILKGGMHHLEAQFMFEELTQGLSHLHIRMMEPFSHFPYLKQAFTEGEIWRVDPSRVQKLVKAGKISREQADKFLSYGAVGSHLENLQRREGYKGFNQKNVSVIIRKTDPRLN
jgi:hypothetical protein